MELPVVVNNTVLVVVTTPTDVVSSLLAVDRIRNSVVSGVFVVSTNRVFAVVNAAVVELPSTEIRITRFLSYQSMVSIFS